MFSSLVLCGALAFAPEPKPAPATESVAEAQALFDAGQAKYETHDYRGAIADFTAAYQLAQSLDDSAQRDEVLARLSFNLARAHVSAFDVDGDPEHVELARRLLADYRGHERAMGRDPDADTDVERLELDLRERERTLAERGSESGSEVPTSEPSSTMTPKHEARRRAGISMLAITPAFAGLAIAGGLLAGQAKDEFESVTTGDARLDAQRTGRLGDVLLGVGVGLAAVSAIAGVTLVVLARPKQPGKLAVSLRPTGVVLEGRF